MNSDPDRDESNPPAVSHLSGVPPQAEAILATLGQTRASRYLRPDPVDPELLRALVWAASRASSPNNTQLWSFVVVTEVAQRAAVRASMVTFERWIADLPPAADESEDRTRRGAAHLLDNLALAPALIIVCGEDAYPREAPRAQYLWSAIGGASQNLVVAARALGLGATVTMFHVADERAIAELLSLPDEITIGAIIPVGWPARPFGPVRRRPLSETMHHERW